MKAFGAITVCQVCDNPLLQSALFLGYLPPVNTMRSIGAVLHEESCFPAELFYCPQCHLAQLGYAVDPNVLFPPEYPYTSGTTKILRDNFADLYREVQDRMKLSPQDLVVDVGSNDGTLLSNFQTGHRVLGIEPSLTGKLAEQRGIKTIMSFFNAESVDHIRAEFGQPALVTATNVFAHIHNVHELMDNLARLVGDRGVFISESHYFRDLVDTLQYDTIYHEHLRYYSLTSIKYLLERHGFRVFFARRIPTHGGSIRVYATRTPLFPADPVVEQILKEEKEGGLASGEWIADFRKRTRNSKVELYELVAKLQRQGARIYGIGAPSRASTLINYVGLDDGILECVLEVQGSKKLDKYIPGTKIPVLDESKLYKDQPEFVLLLSWHITAELCRNLKRHGFKGDFIVPLPSPHVVRNADA